MTLLSTYERLAAICLFYLLVFHMYALFFSIDGLPLWFLLVAQLIDGFCWSIKFSLCWMKWPIEGGDQTPQMCTGWSWSQQMNFPHFSVVVVTRTRMRYNDGIDWNLFYLYESKTFVNNVTTWTYSNFLWVFIYKQFMFLPSMSRLSKHTTLAY